MALISRKLLWPAWILKKRLREYFYNQFFQNVEGGSLLVRLPAHKGVFWVNANSHTCARLLKKGEYEPASLSLIEQFVDGGKDIIDVLDTGKYPA